jgi:hypothetical protein
VIDVRANRAMRLTHFRSDAERITVHAGAFYTKAAQSGV